MSIEIRLASPEDFLIIRNIAFKTWPATFGAILTESQIKYMLRMMYDVEALYKQLSMGHKFLLASLNGHYLGFASFQVNYKPHTIKLHKIYILPEAQGKGAGKALIEKVEKQGKKQKSKTLLLNVNRENKAVEFYQRLGFAVVGEEDIDIGNGFYMNDFIMAKSLEMQ